MSKQLQNRGSVAESLVRLTLELGSLWHDASKAGWVDFTFNGGLQTARIRSKRFRAFLSYVVWERDKQTISSEAWSQAADTLECLARLKHEEREVFLRVGRHRGSIYIDLGKDSYLDLGENRWLIVQVTEDGWECIPHSSCPIRFYRPECQAPLPLPNPKDPVIFSTLNGFESICFRTGSLDDLWRLVNCKPEDRPLILGWLLSCLIPDGAKPILVLTGEPGSGKSSAASILRRLVDPAQASKISGVKDERSMASAISNHWVLVFDHLTSLSSEQQDLLCRVSTGIFSTHWGGTFLGNRRPQILTGVDLAPTRSDLLDRSLIVRLDRIPEESRLTEAELENLVCELVSDIYGALLDLLVTALRNLPETRPDQFPRMADFARLCLAAGIPNFAEAYAANIQASYQAAIEVNPVSAGIQFFLETTGGYWQGTATELIAKLRALDPSNRYFRRLSARSIGRKLASSLRRDLAAVGVEVDQGKGSRGERFLVLSQSRVAVMNR